jgi:hypothetical protein
MNDGLRKSWEASHAHRRGIAPCSSHTELRQHSERAAGLDLDCQALMFDWPCEDEGVTRGRVNNVGVQQH